MRLPSPINSILRRCAVNRIDLMQFHNICISWWPSSVTTKLCQPRRSFKLFFFAKVPRIINAFITCSMLLTSQVCKPFLCLSTLQVARYTVVLAASPRGCFSPTNVRTSANSLIFCSTLRGAMQPPTSALSHLQDHVQATFMHPLKPVQPDCGVLLIDVSR